MMTRTALPLLLALGLAACAPEPTPDADAPPAETLTPADSATTAPAPDLFPPFARRATAVELGLDAYREVDGTWQAGDTEARFTAYFDADSLRLIEAIVDRGDYGDATSAYYFERGQPFYVVQDEQRTRLDPRENGRRDTVQTRVAFGPDGAVVAAEQIVNGAVQAAPPIEVEGVWNHARALAVRAREIARPAL